MNLYSDYFLKNILWLQDGFRHYYVQHPDLLRRDIVDVKLKRFRAPEEAVDWLACCAQYDAFYTLLHLRSFLSDHSLGYAPVFRYDDRTVLYKVADLLGANRHAIVERPKYLTATLLVDPDSIFAHILGRKPGDVYDWGQGEFTRKARYYAQPLTDGEKAYIEHFGLARIAPDKLTDQQAKEASQLFGDGPNDRAQYANWRSRARIINHYRFTHPATINGLMTTYRLARDSNPIHFALERGWQIGSGKEMFTGLKVSRAQAGLELLLSIGVVKLLGLRAKPERIAPTETQPGCNATRKASPGPQNEPEARGKAIDQKPGGGYTKELKDIGKDASSETIVSESAGKLKFDKTTKSWTSSGGLVYEQGSAHGNRVKHIIDHTIPNPSKPVHSVFNVDKSKVIGLVDEAWTRKVGPGTLQPNGNRVWIVDMGKEVGTAGQKSIQIVVRNGTNNLITAFPK